MKYRTQPSIKGLLAIGGGLAMLATAAQGAVINAFDVTNGSASFTTGDGLVTLTPYSQVSTSTVGTFGVVVASPASSSFFGVGTDNKISDIDGDPATTGDREAIDIELAGTVSLTGISLRWTRAAGAAPDGVVISGFLADPGASTASGVGISYSSGSLFLNYAWDAGAIRSFVFSNLSASLGQTLRVSVNDADNPGPQASINTITYVPEPSAALLGGLGLLALLRRRR
jgi:hypothetical protein